ncbi:MAG: tetratricopeptide repeat protein [Bradymonadaceae bacterium]
MIKRYTILTGFIMLAMSMTATNAWAQSEEDINEAGRLYEEGIEAFQQEEFDEAIELFEKAYSHDPHPMFLYNISVAHSRQGNIEQAHETAGRIYDDENLPADTLVRNAGRYHGLGASMSASELADEIASRPEDDDDDGDDDDDDDDGGGFSGIKTPAFIDAIGLSWMGWTGAGLATTGVTFMIIAGVISSSLGSDLDGYEEARLAGDRNRMDELRNEIEPSQSTGRFFLYAGTGLALAGSGLLVYDLMLRDKGDDRQVSARVSTMITPQSASMGLQLSF